VSYLREFNFPIDRVAGYSKTDIILTYKDVTERWTAAAYVNNLEDTAVRSSGWTTLGHYFTGYNAPRMAGVRLAYSFQ
jgi:outer membrane receptor protein involved in Fe transport